MTESRLEIAFKGGDAGRLQLEASELRNRLLDVIPPDEGKVSLATSDNESLQFFETILVDAIGAGLVHLALHVIARYQRGPGVTIRIKRGDREVILDDMTQDAASQLQQLIDNP